MKRSLVASVLVVALVTSCVGCVDYRRLTLEKSSGYKEVEYEYLISLSVLVNKEDCNVLNRANMKSHSDFLVEFSKDLNNANIAATYLELDSMIEELYKKEQVSDTYCRLKLKNISSALTKIRSTFRER